MSCKLYIMYYEYKIKVPGVFKNKEAALEFYSRNKESFRQKDGSYGKPIWVETGKGRRK